MRISSAFVLIGSIGSIAACGAVEHGAPDASGAADAAGDVDAPPGAADASAPDAAPVGGCASAPMIAGTGAITSWTRLTGNVSTDYGGNGVHAVDVTQFANVWHYWSSSPDPVPWPGGYGVIATIPVPTNRYVSAELTIPPTYFSSPNKPANLYGEYEIGETNFSARLSMTISTHCGDFGQLNPSTVVPGCTVNAIAADNALIWRDQSSCVLTDGQTYYLNIINADISALASGGTATTTTTGIAKCAGGSCTDPIANGPGTWPNYTP